MVVKNTLEEAKAKETAMNARTKSQFEIFKDDVRTGQSKASASLGDAKAAIAEVLQLAGQTVTALHLKPLCNSATCSVGSFGAHPWFLNSCVYKHFFKTHFYNLTVIFHAHSRKLHALWHGYYGLGTVRAPNIQKCR